MFYKIGFYILLVLLIGCVALFLKTNPMKTTGALSWIDIYSNNPTATVEFLNDNLGIKTTAAHKTPTGQDYIIIKAPGQVWPFAGVMETPKLPDGSRGPVGTTAYLTGKDYDAMHDKVVAAGATPISTHMITDGMKFGFYVIPGDVGIALVQYEHVKSDKE